MIANFCVYAILDSSTPRKLNKQLHSSVAAGYYQYLNSNARKCNPISQPSATKILV